MSKNFNQFSAIRLKLFFVKRKRSPCLNCCGLYTRLCVRFSGSFSSKLLSLFSLFRLCCFDIKQDLSTLSTLDFLHRLFLSLFLIDKRDLNFSVFWCSLALDWMFALCLLVANFHAFYVRIFWAEGGISCITFRAKLTCSPPMILIKKHFNLFDQTHTPIPIPI